MCNWWWRCWWRCRGFWWCWWRWWSWGIWWCRGLWWSTLTFICSAIRSTGEGEVNWCFVADVDQCNAWKVKLKFDINWLNSIWRWQIQIIPKIGPLITELLRPKGEDMLVSQVIRGPTFKTNWISYAICQMWLINMKFEFKKWVFRLLVGCLNLNIILTFQALGWSPSYYNDDPWLYTTAPIY